MVKKLPSCPASLREAILARAKAEKPPMPESITRLITIPEAFVRARRKPRAPPRRITLQRPHQMWLQNGKGGEKIFIRSGDVVECDDATVNFSCLRPLDNAGLPMLGKIRGEGWSVSNGSLPWMSAAAAFWLLPTRPGKSSYRAEDVLSLMRAVILQHGIPKIWRLEKGVWKSGLVENAIKTMGSRLISVHKIGTQKLLSKGCLGKLWTKLSMWFPDASVGRFRGDNSEAANLLQLAKTASGTRANIFPCSRMSSPRLNRSFRIITLPR